MSKAHTAEEAARKRRRVKRGEPIARGLEWDVGMAWVL